MHRLILSLIRPSHAGGPLDVGPPLVRSLKLSVHKDVHSRGSARWGLKMLIFSPGPPQGSEGVLRPLKSTQGPQVDPQGQNWTVLMQPAVAST
ncbi:unnamed protein product [Arctogadus glacialis]